VFCNFVLQNLNDEDAIKCIRFCNKILKEGGILFSKDNISDIEQKDEGTQTLIRTKN
jgi:hypothetical protein